MQYLQNDFTTVELTARHPLLKEATGKNLSEVHFDQRYYINEVESMMSKADVCVQRGIDVLVEDTLRHAREADEKGVNTIVMAQPWNRDTTLPRADNWGDVLRHIYGGYLQGTAPSRTMLPEYLQ